MGGPGSGNHYHWWRSRKKATVEGCRALDIKLWAREGVIREGTYDSGSCRWQNTITKDEVSSIGYETNTLDPAHPWVRLFYTITRTQEEMDYRVGLQVTRPRFGGVRWWFTCPLVVNGVPCDRRVGKLYLPSGARYYGCRKCYGLTYRSCQESHRADCLYRLMAERTGQSLADVRRTLRRIGKGRT